MHNPTLVDCAVLHAGPSILLAMESRLGRYPVKVLSTSPSLQWECQDGAIEAIELSGAYALRDQQHLEQEVLKGELLIAEFNDMKRLGDDPASHWLMGMPDEGPRERAR